MVNTPSVARGRDAWNRILAVAGTIIILVSLLGIAAARPAGVLAASINPVAGFNITTTGTGPSGTYVAGLPFGVTVTAVDKKGKTVTNFSGPVNLSGLAESPDGDDPTHGSLTWASGVGTTTATATRSQAGAAVTATSVDDPTVSKTSAVFTVQPASVASLAFADANNGFDGEPVDTEANQNISSSLTSFTAVKVVALDDFGNRVGGVSVQIASAPAGVTGTSPKTTSSSGAPGTTGYGEASFNDLKIGTFGVYALAASSGALDAISQSFEIVADLALCNGQSCVSNGKSVSATSPQLTYSNIKTGGDFDDEVVLTTQFLGAGGTDCVGDDVMIGETTEVRVQDAGADGVSATEPDFAVALIYPRTTLQFLGVASRGIPSFQVCLGATLLETGHPIWQAKATSDSSTLQDAGLSGGAYWGWAPDCAAVASLPENPCIVVRTKDASVLATALGLTANQVKQLPFKSGDLAVVLSKPWPWDGKMGLK